MIERVLFYINWGKVQDGEAVREGVRLCRKYGVECVFLSQDREKAEALFEQEKLCFTDSPEKSDIQMIFTFGGDGTVLSAIDRMAQLELPILGMNLGRMGFLLEADIPEMENCIRMLLEGKYEIEKRMILSMEAHLASGEIRAFATNEISINRGYSQRMIALDVKADGVLVEHYIADGVIVASPTGSTGYSLSAGGPIITPDVECLLVCPICPHMLQARPIILSEKSHITVSLNMLEEREGMGLSVDGQIKAGLRNGDEIHICRSPHDALLVRFSRERNYFELLKGKLSQWSL